MKNLSHLNEDRIEVSTYPPGDETCGAFMIPRKRNGELRVIASCEGGWDHVSVSLATQCPTWEDMCRIKSMFFEDYETVVQFHPKTSKYVNDHPFCLHLWRNQSQEHELPPDWMI
jgi:hypothetical protein